eukprot:m.83926 g.83926  ORF g.83926 m.83926 type:complete len:239 (+) comp8700_c0_seq30:78-794(+)
MKMLLVFVGAAVFIIAGVGVFVYLWLKKKLQELQQRAQADANREGRRVEEIISMESFRNEICPICLSDPPNRPVVTNCGHVYCAECFSDYRGIQTGPTLLCPMCRRHVTFLILPPGMEYTPEQLESFRGFIGQEGDNRTFLESVMDIPPLLRLLFHFIQNGYALKFIVQTRVIFVVIGSIFYSVFPIDFLPEAVLGVFGLIDDGVVVLMGLLFVLHWFRAFLIQAQQDRIIQQHQHQE